MAHSAHLYRVNETYYFRIRIPSDIKRWFKGKEDFKRSLRTKVLTSAKLLSKLWSAKTEKLFTMMRTGMLTDSQITAMVRDYYNTTFEDMEDGRSYGALVPKDQGELESRVESIELMLPDLRVALAYNNLEVIESVTEGVLEENNLQIDKGSPSYTKLCRELLKAAIKATEIDLRHMCGDYSSDKLEEKYAVAPIAPAASPSPEPSMPLSQLIKLYVEEKTSKNEWSARGIPENQSLLNMFHEFLGDPEVRTITRQAMSECLATMKRLPARRHQLPEYRDKTLQELLELDPVPNPLGVLTIKKRMVIISSLFRWATQHGYMDRNPAEDLAPQDRRPADQLRKIYPKDVLQKMVNVLAKKYRHKADRPDRWWIPIIGLYTGLRLNEICQLYKDDVKEIDGVWCLDINNHKDKQLKNQKSIRIVPIHPQLIALGFLEYCEGVDHDRLWPALEKGDKGYSHDYGKWFQRINRNHITKDEGMVFHSLRHTFIDTLTQAGAREQAVIELAGHSSYGVTKTVYAKPLAAPIRLEAVKMLDYGIDLEPLKGR